MRQEDLKKLISQNQTDNGRGKTKIDRKTDNSTQAQYNNLQ